MVQAESERRSKNFVTAVRPATTQRHESLRKTLIEHATSHIESNGLQDLRARTLAEAAGCSVGAIYNIFTDLDALILTVNASTLEKIGAKMAAIRPTTPTQQFQDLAAAYLDFAVTHPGLWDALFTHRLPAGIEAPDWFMAIQAAAFSHIEAPLGIIRPDLAAEELPLLARSIFAAIHGIVAFGLEHRTGPIDLPALQRQVTTIAAAMAAGLEKASRYFF
jgi:AcrR family transcriptional regulator